MIETYQYGSAGFKELDNGGDTGFDKSDYLFKFRVNTKSDAKVYQSLNFKVGVSNETSNETYLGLSAEDFAENSLRRYAGSQKDKMVTDQKQYSVKHFIKISPNIEIVTTAYHTEFSRNWYKLDKVIPDTSGTSYKIAAILDDPIQNASAYNVLIGTSSINDALAVKANNRTYFSNGVQTNVGWKFKTGEMDHKADFGVRIHEDGLDRFQWVDNYKMENGAMMLTKKGIGGTESNRIQYSSAISGYINYKFNYRKLSIHPGVRYESIVSTRDDYGKSDPDRTGVDLKSRENDVQVIIPGIGITYEVNEFVNMFTGVHRGFSPAGSKEDVLPERSINYELGSKIQMSRFKGELIGFYNDYSNLLGADLAATGGEGTQELFNGGQAETKGLEFLLSYNVLFNNSSSYYLPLVISYTYTSATFKNSFDSEFEGWNTVDDGDYLPYIPKNQFSLITGIEHKDFSFSLSGKYTDEMLTSAGQYNNSAIVKTDQYFIVDAAFTYKLTNKVNITLSSNNITDNRYVVAARPAGLRPGMPRTYNFGIRAFL